MKKHEMTVKELYKMMLAQGKEDWKIEVRYRSPGGDLDQGQTTDLLLVENEGKKAIVL